MNSFGALGDVSAVAVLSDQPWQTVDNYSSATTGISVLRFEVIGARMA